MSLLPMPPGRGARGASAGERGGEPGTPAPSAPLAAYVLRRGHRKGWRWWLTRRGGGSPVATAPQPVPTSDQAVRDTFRVRVCAATAPAETFTDEDGRHRWRLLTCAGGTMLAVSAVGYPSQAAAERAVRRFRYEASHGEFVDD